MEIMSNRNTCSGKLVLFLVALAVLAGFGPGLAEGQSQDENMEEYEQPTQSVGKQEYGCPGELLTKKFELPSIKQSFPFLRELSSSSNLLNRETLRLKSDWATCTPTVRESPKTSCRPMPG